VRARVVLALGVAGFSAFAALGVACLSDLPDPTSPTSEGGIDTGGAGDAGVCPPTAQEPANDCAGALAQDRGFICPGDASVSAVMGCFAGNRSCTCVNGECALDASSCFASSCPPAVSSAFDASVTCLPLISEQDVLYETLYDPAYAPCYCTCGRCSMRCDGVGSILASGSTFPDSGPYVPISFVITDLVPSSGSLGFYARVRAYSAGSGGLISATFGKTINTPPRYTYVTVLGQDLRVDGNFHDLVFYVGDPSDGGVAGPDSWSTPETAPQTILLTTASADTIVEVDCVIPFFLPE
jgi:hypothetical protein